MFGIYRSVQFCRGVVYVNITINTVLVILTYCGTAVQVVVRDREYANVPAGVKPFDQHHLRDPTSEHCSSYYAVLCCAVLYTSKRQGVRAADTRVKGSKYHYNSWREILFLQALFFFCLVWRRLLRTPS